MYIDILSSGISIAACKCHKSLWKSFRRIQKHTQKDFSATKKSSTDVRQFFSFGPRFWLQSVFWPLRVTIEKTIQFS
jgi:hypothetical protein